MLIQEVREDRVLECNFFHTLEGSAGFAVMTNSFNFFVVGDSDRPKDEIRVSKLATFPGKQSTCILCLAYILAQDADCDIETQWYSNIEWFRYYARNLQ